MSLKWTGNHSETGILRKSEFKEKKEELFVFGYSCKLFRNDDRALHVDQGKHLIPWMGDETLKIDRYDARGALHELSRFEAPPGGYDWRVELTRSEQEVEQLCDEERYRALHTDEDEELMYKEEELKRLHAAGYGQVGFNYEAPGEPTPAAPPAELDEPFEPAPAFKALFQHDVLLPETQKQNAIIEKTAKFIATQGAQMEILIKAKQGDNPQFKFLNKGDELHPYYIALIALVKAEKWPEKTPEVVVEEKLPEPEEYLHPSLASTIIESAPLIPSLQYKPSADCDYSLLISKMRDEGEAAAAPGELPPPGTEPAAHYDHPPLLYNTRVPPPVVPVQTQAIYQQYAAYYQQYAAPPQVKPLAEPPTPRDSTGLSLMKHYGSGTDTESSDSEGSASNDKPAPTEPAIPVPPDDVILFIEKMSTYVARNGDTFADIVRAKNDPRFSFLDPANVYYPYYKKIMQEKRGEELNGDSEKKPKGPVSFSIKKMKEPDPILPKPALPYESSSDEDPDKQDTTEEIKPIQQLLAQQSAINAMPQAVIYKIDGQLTQNLPTVKTIEPMKLCVPKLIVAEVKEVPKPERISVERIFKDIDKKVDKPEPLPVKVAPKELSPVVEKSHEVRVENFEINRREITKESESKEKDDNTNNKKDKKRHKDRQEYRASTESREKRSRSRDREKTKEKDRDRDKKTSKVETADLESEVISLGDNSDDMIDLTGDLSDSKGEGEPESEKTKQQERRRRAAEFLKKVGADPGAAAAAAALPQHSLASAMVETLETIRRKRAADEDKRRRKEKRRRREKRDYEESHRKSKRRKYKSSDDNEESDFESLKKKKRKKDKKPSKKKRRRSPSGPAPAAPSPSPCPSPSPAPPAARLDLSHTLRELRSHSPTDDLVLPDIAERIAEESSSEDEKGVGIRFKKKDREYSEGEWSSDSDADSNLTAEERRKIEVRLAGQRTPIDEIHL